MEDGPADATETARAAAGENETIRLSKRMRITLDEAQNILSIPSDRRMDRELIRQVGLSPQTSILFYLHSTKKQKYEHLFAANSPPEPETSPSENNVDSRRPTKKAAVYHSHYLQSKVVRAKERLEAELDLTDPPTDGAPVDLQKQVEQTAEKQDVPGTASTVTNQDLGKRTSG